MPSNPLPLSHVILLGSSLTSTPWLSSFTFPFFLFILNYISPAIIRSHTHRTTTSSFYSPFSSSSSSTSSSSPILPPTLFPPPFLGRLRDQPRLHGLRQGNPLLLLLEVIGHVVVPLLVQDVHVHAARASFCGSHGSREREDTWVDGQQEGKRTVEI